MERKLNSRLVLAYIGAVVLFFVGIFFGIEDSRTTIAGYMSMQTAKSGNPYLLGVALALLLQLSQYVFGYWWLRDRTVRLAPFLSILACVADVYYDYNYKTSTFGTAILNSERVSAITETIVLYTFGSEITIVLSLTFLTTYYFEFVSEVPILGDMIKVLIVNIVTFIASLGRAIADTLHTAMSGDEDAPSKVKPVTQPDMFRKDR